MLLLRLRLRSWFLGWGLHPEELRVLSAYSRHAFWVCLQGAILLEAIIPVASFIQYRSVDFASAARVMAVPQVFILGFALSYLARSLIYRRRAREATLVPEHLIGYCYRVAFDPPSPCFIRFGVSAEAAHWYAVPLEWEELISAAPPGMLFELWVLPATGWVERLRRGGAEPREVTQPAPDLRPLTGRNARGDGGEPPNDGDIEADAAEDDGATKAEARAMRRYARHAGLMWQQSPKQLAGWAIVSLLLGLFACTVPLAFAIVLIVVAPQVRRADDMVAIAIMVAIFEVLGGLLLAVCGLPSFVAWRRVRRPTLQAQVTGTVVAWTALRTLVTIRTADGGEQIVRLPPKLAHRIEDRGDLVWITYRTDTGQVLDVRHVAEPVEALAADHQDT